MQPVGVFHLSSFNNLEEDKVVHQWAVNEFVVYLIKHQDILEYKTVKERKEVYSSYIELPGSISLSQMILYLKKCQVMVDENGVTSFFANCYTWKNPNIESKEMASFLVVQNQASDENHFVSSFSNYCRWKDPTTKIHLIRGPEGLIWNIFHRFTKQSFFFSFARATIPSLRCHPETIALIGKIKAEPFHKTHLDFLKKDFKVIRVINPDILRKEYEAINTDLEECKKALKDYEVLKTDRELLLGDFDLHVTAMRSFKGKHEVIKKDLEKCKRVLELKKNYEDRLMMTSVAMGSGVIFLTTKTADIAMEATSNFFGDGILGLLTGRFVLATATGAALFSGILGTILLSRMFFSPRSVEIAVDEKLELLQKKTTLLATPEPLLIEIEPISASSRIDERVRVSKFTWAVTLITHEGSNGNHAKIIVEGLNDGFYSHENPHIKNENTVKNGEIFTYMAEFNPPIKSQIFLSNKKLKYDTRTEIWMVTSDKVKKMIESIEDESSLPEERQLFNYWGIRSKIYKFNPDDFWNFSGKVGDNCFTWAQRKLRILNIDLGKSRIDHVAALVKNYTKRKEEYKILPVQQRI